MTLQEILPYITLIGGSGVTVVILNWLRFKKADTADVLVKQAGADKTNAESHEIRARADVLITDGALRIVDRLSKDLDEARDEIDRLEGINSEMKKSYTQSQIDFAIQNNALMEKIEESKKLIETKKRHCIETKGRIIQLRDLLLLKQQGLTPQQLEDFIKKLNELINPSM